MPTLEELTQETALPSSVFPSDHLRIECLFECDVTKAGDGQVGLRGQATAADHL